MKPELLLPAGNTESFYAALEGGADAIYFGLQDFNARQRAKNFTLQQLPALVGLARKKNVKLYVALNIVVKNSELPAVYLILHQIQQSGIDAVIIQDLGLLFLINKYFPKLNVHASTQMGFHNATGVNFAQRLGIERVVLARELTFKELTEIRRKTKAELEVFVHGALCYSFSGLCLFSSYLGGMSANRGACKQPCRRLYADNDTKKYLFSLKDNELIDLLPQLSDLKINSLKVEGRLKTADYVYTIARAYRMALDNPKMVKEAKQLLKRDIGREKTSYFAGGKTGDAFSQVPNTGMFAGYVLSNDGNTVSFSSFIPADEIDKIRICSPNGEKKDDIKLTSHSSASNTVSFPYQSDSLIANDMVYVTAFASKKFPSKLPNTKATDASRPSYTEIKTRVSKLVKYKQGYHPQLYIRIDSLAWLKSIRFEMFDYLIVNLPQKEWEHIPLGAKNLRNNISRLIVELPKFISEENCENYKKLTHHLFKQGIQNFMVGHISQKALIPPKANIHANENVYVFNDAAAAQLELSGIQRHIFPLETDFKNLAAGSNRSGIVPIYYYPQLFFSRLPVKTENPHNIVSDDNNFEVKIIRRDGMSITIPLVPTSLLHEKHNLSQKGFKNFLIDLSFEQPSPSKLNSLLTDYRNATRISPSSAFNFKGELK
ncbi:MAG: U32 family peptidase [Bacteroidales bacterium]|nr:U32 family peptidase [Bacteroidales bacterium]